MKLHTFDLPDDPAMLAQWLDHHLLGLHLHQLVAELTILGASDGEPGVSVTEVLGERIHAVLQTGLGSLPREQLRQLIRKPRSLLELQRLVLDDGGDYWRTLPASPDVPENSRKTWTGVEKAICGMEPQVARPAQFSAVRRPWIWAGAGWLAAAAAICFAVFVQEARVQQLNDRLAERSAANDALRQELQARQAVAACRVLPADLPESAEFLVQATPDPADLPQDDPDDLPEISRPRSKEF